MHQWGCITFLQKSAKMEVPRKRAFELILARIIDAEMRLFAAGGQLKLNKFCLCFVQVCRIEPEGHAPGLVACRCI